MQKEGIFYTHKYFKLLHANNPCTMWTSKNPIFIRATPCQRGFASKCPMHKFRCVFLQNKALGPGGNLCFLAFLLPHIFSEMPIFIVRKGAVPEPAFRWTPNRPVFEETRSPWQPSGIYIYLYILKIGPFFCFFLFLKISFSLQKEEDFWKTSKNNNKKNTISKVKNWSNYVAQHTWTSF